MPRIEIIADIDNAAFHDQDGNINPYEVAGFILSNVNKIIDSVATCDEQILRDKNGNTVGSSSIKDNQLTKN